MYKSEWKMVSNEEYHAMPGISSSGMQSILRSPAHFKANKIETSSMAIGTAFHTAILEPEEFKKQYAVNAFNGTTKAGKERKAEIIAAGQTCLKQDDYDNVVRMQEAALSNDLVCRLIGGNVDIELSGFYHDKEYKVDTRIRPDIINHDKHCVADLKKVQDARPRAFAQSCTKYGYDIQAAHYLFTTSNIECEKWEDFYFICVEEQPPHGVMVYKASVHMIIEGLHKRRDALARYAWCIDSGMWPNYTQDEVSDIDLTWYPER